MCHAGVVSWSFAGTPGADCRWLPGSMCISRVGPAWAAGLQGALPADSVGFSVNVMVGYGPPGRPEALRGELTGFVGRRLELAAVRAAVAGARLVTLTGPGGIGKTRLAVRAAPSCGGGSVSASAGWAMSWRSAPTTLLRSAPAGP